MTVAAADSYYGEPRVRFEAREGDVLRTPGDLVVGRAPCGVVVESARARARLEICGVSEAEVRAALAAFEGGRAAPDAVTKAARDEVLRAAFGIVLFAPEAVAALESRVSAIEIVRYPSSPYEVVRTYWENMADVAERIDASVGSAGTGPSFAAWLRELHVLALRGASGSSGYVPASPIARKERIEPGELLETPSITEDTPGGTRFVSGPRVNASVLGGEFYGALLAGTAGDLGALARERTFVDPGGLDWGRLTTARADHDPEPQRWFCPPRPLGTRHFEALSAAFRLALGAAAAGDRGATIEALARFHQCFVRLHPFAAGNQCVAMSLVNHVLRRAFGAGIPHLVLDHLALSLSEPAYASTFRLAVDSWLVADQGPVERLLRLAEQRRRSFELLGRVARAGTGEEARALVSTDPEAARWSLLGVPAAQGAGKFSGPPA